MLQQAIRDYAQIAERWRVALAGAADHIERAIGGLIPAEMYGETWLSSTIERLHELFVDDPAAGVGA